MASGDLETGEKDNTPYCKRSLFPTMRALLCDAVDISGSESFDRTPGDCDALSLALEFVAEEAEVGEERAEIPVGNGCADVDPELLRCPK